MEAALVAGPSSGACPLVFGRCGIGGLLLCVELTMLTGFITTPEPPLPRHLAAVLRSEEQRPLPVATHRCAIAVRTDAYPWLHARLSWGSCPKSRV
jgi:hypothetical protein